MAESLLRSIAIHQALHPGMAGALRAPRMGLGRVPAIIDDEPQSGLSGFLDRLTGSPLSQIGMALLAGGGGSLGNAAALMMQQGAYSRLARQQLAAQMMPRMEHIGNQIGMLDPRTGQFSPTYTEPQAPDEFTREMTAAGIDPNSDEGKALLRQHVNSIADPVVNIPLPGGAGSYIGPKSGMEAALQGLSAKPQAPGGLAPPSAPSLSLPAAVASVESGNRDLKPDGSPVTNLSSGAKYAMQVLPSTAANPGFGVAPAQSDTPAEYDRVGRDYLGAMQRRYGGNVPEALAAFNAGPGTVDKALASGSPLPSQGYVNKVMGMMGGSDIVSQAQAAIAAGADPQKVRARAAQMGVQLP